MASKIKKVSAVLVILTCIALFIVVTVLAHRDRPALRCPTVTPPTVTPPTVTPPTVEVVIPPPPTEEPPSPTPEDETLDKDRAAPSGPRPWDPVKDRLPKETKYEWADRIYSVMLKDRPSNTSEGGVRHIADDCGLDGMQRLTHRAAKCACTNPCSHYAKGASGQRRIEEAQACSCEFDPNKFNAINF
jgi:hypothetical protein